MPKWIEKILASNVALGVVIFVGLVMSAVTWFVAVRENPYHYDSATRMEPVEFKSFTNQEVNLDGKAYRHCTFTNVKFRYNGRTPMILDQNQFNGSIRITTDNPQVAIAWELAKGVGFMRDVPVYNLEGHPEPRVTDPTMDHTAKPQQ